MSVHQLIAYHTIMTVHRVVTSQYPKYMAYKLQLRKPDGDGVFPLRQVNTINVPKTDLTLSRGGFVVRGAILWNSLPIEMRSETKKEYFRKSVRKWVKENIHKRPP